MNKFEYNAIITRISDGKVFYRLIEHKVSMGEVEPEQVKRTAIASVIHDLDPSMLTAPSAEWDKRMALYTCELTEQPMS